MRQMRGGRESLRRKEAEAPVRANLLGGLGPSPTMKRAVGSPVTGSAIDDDLGSGGAWNGGRL